MRVGENRRERRRLCADCRARRAKFRHGGVVKADRAHTLCFQCYRAARDRSRLPGAGSKPVPPDDRLEPPPAAQALTPRQVAHRRRMLAHLRRQAAGGD
jgi:hypothetical protein